MAGRSRPDRPASPKRLPPLSQIQLAIIALACGALTLATAAFAEVPDPVDVQLNTCLEKPESQSTAGMESCMVAADAAYDKQLNAVYQQVITSLDPPSRDLLRAAQRQWLAFRQAERAAQAGPWREGRGTITQLAVQSAALSAMKQRIDELRLYLP